MFKKSVYSLLVLCLSLGSLSAQGDLRLGVQLSPTFSSLGTPNNLINSDGANLGVKLGLIAEYYFQENYSIHTGFGFHFNAGGTLNYDEQFTSVDIWRESLNEALTNPPSSLPGGSSFKYDIQILEVPLGLTLRTREFGYLRYYARPSLHLGIVTGSKGSLANSGLIGSDEKFNISEEVNAVNLGWSFGAGVEYAISTDTRLIGGIGYQGGFADLTKDNDTQVVRTGRQPAEDDSKGTLRGVVITLGIMF